MTGVRWRDDTGFEGQCEVCREYWPLDQEFWQLPKGFRRCRACHLEARARRERAKYAETHGAAYKTPRARAMRRERDRRYKAEARRDPERRPHILERQRLATRKHYETKRAEVLARRRELYASKLDRPLMPGIGRPRLEDAA